MVYLKELKINKRKVTKIKANNYVYFYIANRLKAFLKFDYKYKYFKIKLKSNNETIFNKTYLINNDIKKQYKKALNKIYDYLKECKY